jgi:hypothetical protein
MYWCFLRREFDFNVAGERSSAFDPLRRTDFYARAG